VLGWVGRSLSIELLRAALFVGTFGGLQVAISATTDETYRADFLGQVTADVREAVAVSLRLRALHGRSETAVESPQEPR
jgi:hypothetical protein